ncbi:hypothetical protein [Paenibacillus chitinolyticus]|uniref:hypothetical protein n=1 Tax=Paenibacillus chitinolyticus TaxID=79263 RepID=UPI003CFC6064
MRGRRTETGCRKRTARQAVSRVREGTAMCGETSTPADRATEPTGPSPGPQRLPLRASGLARIASLPSEGPRFATGGSFPYDEEKIAFLAMTGRCYSYDRTLHRE